MATRKTKRDRYGQELYLLRQGGMEWGDIYERFPGETPSTLRRIEHEERRNRDELQDQAEAPRPAIEGLLAAWEELDEEEVWQAALQAQAGRDRKERRRQNQIIQFDHGPVGIALLADLHVGSGGTDYAQLDRDLDLINATPGLYSFLVGDLLDNWIKGALMMLQAEEAINVAGQWLLVKRVIRKLGSSLLVSVGGNHDLWTLKTSGLDFLGEIHSYLSPGIIYHRYDVPLVTQVGGADYVWRIRHQWKGNSQYNPTHGIEYASKFDKGRHFDIGVGGHIHTSGLVREFNNGGQTGLAVLCGTYKRHDDFPDERGFPQANRAAAMVVVLEEDGIWGTGNLAGAARYLQATYRA